MLGLMVGPPNYQAEVVIIDALAKVRACTRLSTRRLRKLPTRFWILGFKIMSIETEALCPREEAVATP